MPELPDELELTAPQTRILGCLMEKQATTPDVYPMTLKALTTACNQTSSRYPVVDYEQTLVETTVHALKSKGLARVVHPAHGERATKYRHIADEVFGLDSSQRALIAVLSLRGAQTVAELRTRTERMHRFDSQTEVESVLAGLSSREIPLVAPVDRQPGQKEQRWIQLLEVDPEGRAVAPSAPAGVSARSAGVDGSQLEALTGRVTALERRLAVLAEALGDLLPPGALEDVE